MEQVERRCSFEEVRTSRSKAIMDGGRATILIGRPILTIVFEELDICEQSPHLQPVTLRFGHLILHNVHVVEKLATSHRCH